MMDLSKDGMTHEQIKSILHMASGSQVVRFKYNLLDKDDNFISELKNVESGQIQQSAFSDIKRTGRFTLTEDSYITESYATWGDVGEKKWSDL